MKKYTQLAAAALLLGGLILIILGLRLPAVSAQTANQEAHRKTMLSGNEARRFLTETKEGKSLWQAITATSFALQRQGPAPNDAPTGGDYLALSHEQNLNASFGDKGVTIRPTLPSNNAAQAWSAILELTAYGYGDALTEVPPIAAHTVNGNRIEYLRTPYPAFAFRTPAVVEWYENRAEGIEQGFTLSERPQSAIAPEASPLRLSLAVQGDLRAVVKDHGERIELGAPGQKPSLSYAKLTAIDATGRRLAAHMEANREGREITLVVQDQMASYPLVIDPMIATLDTFLEAGNQQQTDSRFGFAVAIDGDTAIVGAWRQDYDSITPDAGAVYTFRRTNLIWDRLGDGIFVDPAASASCGWSVATLADSAGDIIAWGCPGANDQTGRAFFSRAGVSQPVLELVPASAAPFVGDQYGYSVALGSGFAAVGAPFRDSNGIDDGRVNFIYFDSNLQLTSDTKVDPTFLTGNFGASLAVDRDLTVIGAPNWSSAKGRVGVYDVNLNENTIFASDGAFGDNFGNSVAISGDTMVVGAWGNDERDTDAGAAYVYVQDSSGVWTEQQKLTAEGDGQANDHFSEHAVAIEGETIVVGATGRDLEVSGDDAGAAYIFTRNNTVWTLQDELLDGEAASNFGIAVDLSGDNLLVGARAASVISPPRSGGAFLYQLLHSLGNISTRAAVGTGDNVLIGGFIVDGVQAKKVLVRAIGPSTLLPGALLDPSLELHTSTGDVVSNGNWRDNQEAEILATGLQPNNDLESAIVATLPANASYTAIVRGAAGGTGVGLVEVYDLDQTVDSKLANISTRALVQTGDNVLIGGFIVVGAAPQQVLVRAIGPSLPLSGTLADPTLELFNSDGAMIAMNDNWRDSQEAEIQGTAIPPPNDLESAILISLPPGANTAILRGKDGGTGIGLIEVYALQ